jgi:hypothetical protein
MIFYVFFAFFSPVIVVLMAASNLTTAASFFLLHDLHRNEYFSLENEVAFLRQNKINFLCIQQVASTFSP